MRTWRTHSGWGCWLLVAPVAAVLSSAPAGAQEPSVPGGSEAFAVVVEGNIFNPDRGAAAPPPRVEADENQPEASLDRIVLNGVLISETNAYCFFNGTESDYRKVVAINGEIAGLNLRSLTSTAAVLGSGTNEFRLRVGDELERVGGAPWRVVSGEGRGPLLTGRGPRPPEPGGETPPSEAGESAGGKEQEAPAGMSDALKRLMEKRRKEAGQ